MIILQFALCVFMCGLIWMVQVVHYPSFTFIDEVNFTSFQEFHMRSISYIVMPVMILELGIAAYLAINFQTKMLWINLGLLGLIWASTFFLSVPTHNKLVSQKSIEAINYLVLTNWPRTILWTVRSFLLGFVLYENFQAK